MNIASTSAVALLAISLLRANPALAGDCDPDSKETVNAVDALWSPGQHLTWSIGPSSSISLDGAIFSAAMTLAAKKWSDVCNLTFSHSADDADIRVQFGKREHDVQGWANMPPRRSHTYCEIIFNDFDFTWVYSDNESLREGKQRNLLFAAQHELGHCIGNYHSCTPGKTMFPVIPENFELSDEDVQRTQDTYGIGTQLDHKEVNEKDACGSDPSLIQGCLYFYNRQMDSFMTPPDQKGPVGKATAEYANPWEFLVLSDDPWMAQIKPNRESSLCLEANDERQVSLADCDSLENSQRWMVGEGSSCAYTTFKNVATVGLLLDSFCEVGDQVCMKAGHTPVSAYQVWNLFTDPQLAYKKTPG